MMMMVFVGDDYNDDDGDSNEDDDDRSPRYDVEWYAKDATEKTSMIKSFRW